MERRRKGLMVMLVTMFLAIGMSSTKNAWAANTTVEEIWTMLEDAKQNDSENIVLSETSRDMLRDYLQNVEPIVWSSSKYWKVAKDYYLYLRYDRRIELINWDEEASKLITTYTVDFPYTIDCAKENLVPITEGTWSLNGNTVSVWRWGNLVDTFKLNGLENPIFQKTYQKLIANSRDLESRNIYFFQDGDKLAYVEDGKVIIISDKYSGSFFPYGDSVFYTDNEGRLIHYHLQTGNINSGEVIDNNVTKVLAEEGKICYYQKNKKKFITYYFDNINAVYPTRVNEKGEDINYEQVMEILLPVMIKNKKGFLIPSGTLDEFYTLEAIQTVEEKCDAANCRLISYPNIQTSWDKRDYYYIKGIEYRIQKGDNLTKIAEKFSTTVQTLVKDNEILDENLIYEGNTLKIYLDVLP